MNTKTTNYIGSSSKGLRFLIVAVFVIIYWGIGRIFNMSTSAYQVLGVPITVYKFYQRTKLSKALSFSLFISHCAEPF